MSVKFTVQQQFDFTQFDYIIIFNTSGNGITPLPNGGAQANWTGFSDALIVSGNSGGGVNAIPVQFVRSGGTSLPPAVIGLVVPPQDLQFQANSNTLGTQFQVEFNRKIFSSLVTPTPSTSPAASPSPTASPTPSISGTWLFNCFVTQTGTTGGAFGGQSGNYTPVNSLGIGGGTDTSFVSPKLNTNISFDITQNSQSTYSTNPSAAIVNCEIANNP
jgi:hypothetical protein